MNKPIRYLRNPDGTPILEDDEKQYTEPLALGFNPSKDPNRRQRRQYLQKVVKNPLYGISKNSKYIQLVPETVKDEEGIVVKLGRILNNIKRKFSYTGKIKVIDHYPYKTK
jgi:hypothetical protein